MSERGSRRALAKAPEGEEEGEEEEEEEEGEGRGRFTVAVLRASKIFSNMSAKIVDSWRVRD